MADNLNYFFGDEYFFAVSSTFDLGGMTKHLMTGPVGTVSFVYFLLDFNVSLGFASGNIEGH